MDNEEFHDIDISTSRNPRSPQLVREYDAADSFPEAWTETALGDQVFLHDMVVKQIDGTWVMLASYWDMGYLELDVDDPADATLIDDTDFVGDDPLTGFDPPEGNAHQAEYSADNKYILTAEEDFAAHRLTEVDSSARHVPRLADQRRRVADSPARRRPQRSDGLSATAAGHRRGRRHAGGRAQRRDAVPARVAAAR